MEYSELGGMNSFARLFRADERVSLKSTNSQSNSCKVEMEPSKNVSADSKITLQRNLSSVKKGPLRSNEKMNSNNETEKADQLVDSSAPEKPILVTVGTTNHQFNQQIHHQITITTPSTTESKLAGRRNSFNRSSSWTFDPRMILLFFATLSSIGTILLIYLTLSMKNVTGDANTMGQ